MKSIDLLFPPEQGDKSEQLPDTLSGANLVEQLSKTLVEVVEKQNDSVQDLSKTFKETITKVLEQNVSRETSPEEDSGEVDQKEDEP